MGYERYRVRRAFDWNGWQFAPNPNGACSCDGGACGFGDECTKRVGTSCSCDQRACRCSCRIPENRYAGDIWFIQEGDPRKAAMLEGRFAVGDAGLESAETLLARPEFKRLLGFPVEPPRRRNKLAPAATR